MIAPIMQKQAADAYRDQTIGSPYFSTAGQIEYLLASYYSDDCVPSVEVAKALQVIVDDLQKDQRESWEKHVRNLTGR